jgi:hypothetical protein
MQNRNSQDCNSNCVIPVLLEECKIPIKLQHLTYCDMTIEQDFVFVMRRLVTNFEHGDNPTANHTYEYLSCDQRSSKFGLI